MKLHWARFNHFLVVGLLCVLAWGCNSPGAGGGKKEQGRKSDATSLAVFQEASADGRGGGTPVPISREQRVPVYIERAPILDDGVVQEAAVVEVYDGFAIQVRFTFHGTLALQAATATKRGSRLAIWARWTEERWLAAPLIARTIDDGILTFTPDATRQEAERIVRGLNNMAEKLGNKPKPKKKQ
jgi:hypothetical protein